MSRGTIILHEENGSWWAESPEHPSFFATGISKAQARGYAIEFCGVPFCEIEMATPAATQGDGE